jgi:hypothetical protein
MNVRKKSLTIILISCVILLANISINKSAIAQSETDWTVMYYLCGDLSFFSKDPLDVLENLTKIGATEGLNILVMKDSIEIGDTQLILVNNKGEKEILNERFSWPDEVDTGNPNTLKLFCKLMMNAYPAKYYALIIVAPGTAGWQLRSLHDQHGSHGPSWPVFGEMLKDITDNGENKIDVIFIESCVLGLIENAYEIAPYVDYMVTSEEHIPDGELCSRRYYEPLQDLKNNIKMTPEEFANRGPYRHNPVNFSFFEGPYASDYASLGLLAKLLNKLPFPKLHTVQMHTTCSAVNLSKINSLITTIDDLASFLILYKDNRKVYNAIKKARSEVREYGKGLARHWSLDLPFVFLGKSFYFYQRLPLEIFAFDCWIDLYNLVDLIGENVNIAEIKNKCLSVRDKLNDTITANTVVPGDESHGLSIYFPSSKRMYNRYVYGPRIPYPYENLRFSKNTMWDEFLKTYLKPGFDNDRIFT